MKNINTYEIFRLIASILIYYLISNYFNVVLSWLNITINESVIITFIKYLLIVILIYIINRDALNIKAYNSKNKRVTNLIFSIGLFVILVLINFLIHMITKEIGTFITPYGFNNYFPSIFNLSSALNLIVECILIPFLVIVVFPVNFGKAIKKEFTSVVLSGICYGLFLGLPMHLGFMETLSLVLTPSIIIMFLTYIYRHNRNAWILIISFILYKMLGVYIMRYFT